MPRITMIGAGSIVFAKCMISDVLSYPELEGSTLALMEVDAHRLDLISCLAEQTVSQSGRRVQVTATGDRREALRGAHYVMDMIQVGDWTPTRRTSPSRGSTASSSASATRSARAGSSAQSARGRFCNRLSATWRNWPPTPSS